MMDISQEQKYIELAKEDIKNIEPIFNAYYSEIFRYSLSIIQDRDRANDITQKTFLTLIEKINDYEFRGISIKYWLLSTARNFCLKDFNYETKQENIDNVNELIDDNEISFVDSIIQKDLVKIILEEVKNLNTLDREVITLKLWEEMTFEDISRIQNTSVSTVKSRFYRAVQKIKINLEKSEDIKLNSISLPIIFTAIHSSITDSSLIPSSFALANLINNSNNMTIMSSIVSFLTTTTGKAVAVSTIAVTTLAGGAGIYIANEQNKDNEIIIHDNSNEKNQENSFKNFTINIGENGNIKFDYPENYQIKINEIQELKNENGNFFIQNIDIISENNHKLTIIYDDTPKACGNVIMVEKNNVNLKEAYELIDQSSNNKNFMFRYFPESGIFSNGFVKYVDGYYEYKDDGIYDQDYALLSCKIMTAPYFSKNADDETIKKFDEIIKSLNIKFNKPTITSPTTQITPTTNPTPTKNTSITPTTSEFIQYIDSYTGLKFSYHNSIKIESSEKDIETHNGIRKYKTLTLTSKNNDKMEIIQDPSPGVCGNAHVINQNGDETPYTIIKQVGDDTLLRIEYENDFRYKFGKLGYYDSPTLEAQPDYGYSLYCSNPIMLKAEKNPNELNLMNFIITKDSSVESLKYFDSILLNIIDQNNYTY